MLWAVAKRVILNWGVFRTPKSTGAGPGQYWGGGRSGRPQGAKKGGAGGRKQTEDGGGGRRRKVEKNLGKAGDFEKKLREFGKKMKKVRKSYKILPTFLNFFRIF